jgi:mono/diheme cytochrome c family protein
MKIAIYISGFALLISFLLILQDDFNQEWKQMQRQFYEIAANRYYSENSGAEEPKIGINQIVASGLNRVDRCNTCHLGIHESKFADSEQPFRSHPGTLLETHKPEKFGCTSCHFGQGYAVSYKKAAHQKLSRWNETMLPKQLLQVGCATCHLSEEVPGAGLLTRGRLLIKDKGCTGCHDINDFFEEEARGPDLSGMGNKVRVGWLYHWLKKPRNYLENSRMPTYSLSESDIVSLMEFLLSLDEKDSPPHPITELPTEVGDEDSGQTLVGESRCISCHSISGRGGTLAPELELVGDKVQEVWLPNFLRNVHYYQPSKVMLEYNFTDQDAVDIASFVFDEYTDETYEVPDSVLQHIPRSEAQRRDRITDGKKLFSKYGCDGCHTINGIRTSPKVGAKLTRIGNRLESSFDFGSIDDVEPTLYNWLFMKVKQPDVFDSSSIMPNFHLTDEEALAITVALFGNREYSYASELLVPETDKSVYRRASGEFGELFDRYSCISCHSHLNRSAYF